MTEFTTDQIRGKKVSELYTKTKLDSDLIEISKIGEESIDRFINEHKIKEDIETGENNIKVLYDNIVQIYKKYCDIKEKYFPIVACWVIGSYLHKKFKTYPYLYANAMKGSGKTRFLKLTAHLCDGEVLNSLTEAVLFRSDNMLAIDEFERIMRKGNENLIELLNSAYKYGCKVKRMKKKKILGNEEQVVEEFDVYRPIAIANISGMDSVLADRCIPIIIERSDNKKVTQLVEIWDSEKITTLTKLGLLGLKKPKNPESSVVSVDVVSPGETYKLWNEYILSQKDTTLTTLTTYTTHTTLTTLTFFDKLRDMEIDGRSLELAMPLLIIANSVSLEVLDELLVTLKEIVDERKMEDLTSNYDISLIDFVSQEIVTTYFRPINNIVNSFKEFLGTNEEWINTRWLGRALKRLNLIKDKKRQAKGVELILDIEKAQLKIKQFK